MKMPPSNRKTSQEFSPSQLDLFVIPPTPEDVTCLVNLLRHRGWLTRQDLSSLLAWSDRKIRAVAQAAGDAIVRGPQGFNAFENVPLDTVLHCAAIAESQATIMLDYARKLRCRAHARIAQ